MLLSYNRSGRVALIVLGVGMAAVLAMIPGAYRANAALGTFGQPGFLGNAESFAVVAATTVTNVVDLTPVPQTVVSGDIGLSPGTSVTGFPPGVVTNGAIYTSVAPPGTTAFDAQADASAARLVVDGLVPDFPNPGVGPVELASTSPVPGVYSADAFLLNGTITLDGAWDDVWVFQSSSTLTTGVGSTVLLAGDANPCNIFWQLDTEGIIQVGSTFVGTVFSDTSITANSGATIEGRLLAQAAVTLDHNQIFTPTCLTGPSAGPGPVPGSTPAAALAATGADLSGPLAVSALSILVGVGLLGAWSARKRRGPLRGA